MDQNNFILEQNFPPKFSTSDLEYVSGPISSHTLSKDDIEIYLFGDIHTIDNSLKNTSDSNPCDTIYLPSFLYLLAKTNPHTTYNILIESLNGPSDEELKKVKLSSGLLMNLINNIHNYPSNVHFHNIDIRRYGKSGLDLHKSESELHKVRSCWHIIQINETAEFIMTTCHEIHEMINNMEKLDSKGNREQFMEFVQSTLPFVKKLYDDIYFNSKESQDNFNFTDDSFSDILSLLDNLEMSQIIDKYKDLLNDVMCVKPLEGRNIDTIKKYFLRNSPKDFFDGYMKFVCASCPIKDLPKSMNRLFVIYPHWEDIKKRYMILRPLFFNMVKNYDSGKKYYVTPDIFWKKLQYFIDLYTAIAVDIECLIKINNITSSDNSSKLIVVAGYNHIKSLINLLPEMGYMVTHNHHDYDSKYVPIDKTIMIL